jgi:cation-transporting ATPase E
LVHVPFPFLPRHVTLVGSLTIGIPGFFLALAPNAERARPGFVARVLRFAVPVGLVCGLAAFVAYGLARDRSAATLALFLAAAWALALIARPPTWWRRVLVVAMVAAFAVIAVVRATAAFFALRFTDPTADAIALGTAAVAAVAMTLVPRRRDL